jgi:hypothetical protein
MEPGVGVSICVETGRPLARQAKFPPYAAGRKKTYAAVDSSRLNDDRMAGSPTLRSRGPSWNFMVKSLVQRPCGL